MQLRTLHAAGPREETIAAAGAAEFTMNLRPASVVKFTIGLA
jgi:hypothetical protein